jgi:hypothetical protein
MMDEQVRLTGQQLAADDLGERTEHLADLVLGFRRRLLAEPEPRGRRTSAPPPVRSLARGAESTSSATGSIIEPEQASCSLLRRVMVAAWPACSASVDAGLIAYDGDAGNAGRTRRHPVPGVVPAVQFPAE